MYFSLISVILVMIGLESEVTEQIKSNLIWKLSCVYRVLMIPYLVYHVQGILVNSKYPNQICIFLIHSEKRLHLLPAWFARHKKGIIRHRTQLLLLISIILVMKISGLESGVKHQRQIKDNQISKLSCAYRVQMILYLVYLVQGILIEKTQPQFWYIYKNDCTSFLHEIIATKKI